MSRRPRRGRRLPKKVPAAASIFPSPGVWRLARCGGRAVQLDFVKVTGHSYKQRTVQTLRNVFIHVRRQSEKNSG